MRYAVHTRHVCTQYYKHAICIQTPKRSDFTTQLKLLLQYVVAWTVYIVALISSSWCHTQEYTDTVPELGASRSLSLPKFDDIVVM